MFGKVRLSQGCVLALSERERKREERVNFQKLFIYTSYFFVQNTAQHRSCEIR